MTAVTDASAFGNEPSLHDLISIAEALADMQRLITLDSIWTSAGGDEFLGRDRQALVVLGRQIEDQIAVVERHVFRLRRIFVENPLWVNSRISEELTSAVQLDTAQRESVRRFFRAPEDDFATRGAEVLDYVSRQASIEREELRRKISDLEEGGEAATDMSAEFACGVLASMVAAGLLTCFKTVGTGCLVSAMAAGAGLALCE
jgi:hypothetical protein